MLVGCQYRQGDVLLVPVRAIPCNAKPADLENGRVVLAHGEVTGHSHSMGADRVRYFREDGSGRGFIQVTGTDPVALSHEEHDQILVDPGTYEVRRQREYRPARLPSLVAD